MPAPSALPTAIGQLPGVSDGSDADAGNVGEEKDTGPVTITYSASGSPKNITSLLLSAGDWDIQAATFQSGSGATTTTDSYSCLTATSTPTISSGCLPFVMHNRYPAAIDEMVVQTTPSVRVSLAAPATYYLHGEVVISSGSIYGATGYIRARRLR